MENNWMKRFRESGQASRKKEMLMKTDKGTLIGRKEKTRKRDEEDIGRREKQ